MAEKKSFMGTSEHRQNIKRLWRGEENRFKRVKKLKGTSIVENLFKITGKNLKEIFTFTF